MKETLSIRQSLDWRRGIVLLLTLGLTVFLIQRISAGVHPAELLEVLLHMGGVQILGLGIAMLLLIPNWLLEAIKLKHLLSLKTSVTLGTCLKGVFAGVTLGLVTPARLGEYGGRVVAFSKERRAEVIGCTVITSLTQMVVTVGVGSISAVVLLDEYQFVNGTWTIITAFMGLLLLTAVFAFFPVLLDRVTQVHWLRDKLSTSTGFITLTRQSLALVLGYSALRYAVYSLQFLLILWVLGATVSWMDLIIHIPIIFLLQTLMPLPPIASLVGRASAAVVVLSQLGLSDTIILTASTIVWVINLVVPAFVGLGFIWKVVTHKEK